MYYKSRIRDCFQEKLLQQKIHFTEHKISLKYKGIHSNSLHLTHYFINLVQFSCWLSINFRSTSIHLTFASNWMCMHTPHIKNTAMCLPVKHIWTQFKSLWLQALYLFEYETRNTGDNVCWVWSTVALVFKNIHVVTIIVGVWNFQKKRGRVKKEGLVK